MTFTTFDLGGHAQGKSVSLNGAGVCFLSERTIRKRPCCRVWLPTLFCDSIKDVGCSSAHLHHLSQITKLAKAAVEEKLLTNTVRRSSVLWIPYIYLQTYLCWHSSWGNKKHFHTSAFMWDRTVVTLERIIILLCYFKLCKTWNCIPKTGNMC